MIGFFGEPTRPPGRALLSLPDRQRRQPGETLGLSEDETAFYDALEANDSSVAVLGDETLKRIAQELKRFLTDHAIEAYSTKLRHWAVSRQQ